MTRHGCTIDFSPLHPVDRFATIEGMSEPAKAPWWYWVIGVVGFLLLGVLFKVVVPEDSGLRIPLLMLVGAGLMVAGRKLNMF